MGTMVRAPVNPVRARNADDGAVAINPWLRWTQIREVPGLIRKLPDLKSVEKKEGDRIERWQGVGRYDACHALDNDLARWIEIGNPVPKSLPNR